MGASRGGVEAFATRREVSSVRNRLFHITSETAAAAAETEYRPAAFDAEGFIHCSHAHQLVAVANRRFRGRRDLVVLEIDRSRLTCRVVEENLEGGRELFPHIYGPLPRAAIAATHPFPSDEAGEFRLPSALRDGAP